MGFWSFIASTTSRSIPNRNSEKQAGTAKGELFADFDATVERLKSFDLEAPVDDKTAVECPSTSNRNKKK